MDPSSPTAHAATRPSWAFEREDMGITPFWTTAPAERREAQHAWHDELRARADIGIAEDAFVSRIAVVHPERLRVGARTYVSGHVHFWGDVKLGEDCTVNPYSEVRGRVRIGDAVRIGAHTSILGFNHGMSTEEPIFRQPLSFRGITIGDDVWIGAHVTVLDGVTIGAHSIVGAGAVVTRDLPEWSIAVGNPARVIRDRRDDAATTGVRASGSTSSSADRDTALLAAIAETAARELPQLLANAWNPSTASFHDRPGAEPTVRAWTDAVELAALFGSPLPVAADAIVDELRGRQDPRTGRVADRGTTDAAPSDDGHAGVNYHVLAAGYALQLLGSRFPVPIADVTELDAQTLVSRLDAQPWRHEGWRAGSWVDALGTAMLWNRADFGLPTQIETLFGWLVTRCDPATGLWGTRAGDGGWLEAVNGFYRLTRGTFAQFGVPLPYPERTIDSVLDHSRDGRYFGPARGTACNVLDVVHPLWLAGRQTEHRREDGVPWAREQLERIAAAWQPGRGFSFALEIGHGWQRTPSLLGTEMWLSITWLLADYLGAADVLDYRPRGIHRPEPATRLGAA